MPSSAQVRYYFAHTSGTTEPILMNFVFQIRTIRFPTTMLISIFSVSVIFLEIFSKNLSDTSILPLFDHFFATINNRRTDGIFFFIFRLFGSRSVERPYLEVRNREITNSVLNL